jgi:hypothetical protein
MGTRRGGWPRRLALAALAAGLAVASGLPTYADEEEPEAPADGSAHVQRVLDALKSGMPAALAALESREVSDGIAADPASAATLSRVALTNALPNYLLDKGNAPKLAAAILAIARKSAATPLAEGCPATPGLDDRARALAFARLAVASTSTLHRKAVPPAEWTEPFAALRKASPDHPTAALDIAISVAVVSVILDDDAPIEPALRAAAETAAFAVRTFPENEYTSELTLRANLALACGLAWTKPSEAKGLLASALAAMSSIKEKVEADEVLVDLWNRGVGEARRLGVACKHDMIARKVSATWFEFELPKGSAWTTERKEDTLFKIRRDRGARSQAVLLGDSYDWTVNYVDDQKRRIGGDNRGGLMRLDHADSLALFTKVTRDDKASKAKLSRRYPDVIGYDIRGLNEDGDEMRVRAWFFAGEKRRQTYRVLLIQFGSVRDRDGQMDFVLESLRETE